jgi:uncharacterized membrane protein
MRDSVTIDRTLAHWLIAICLLSVILFMGVALGLTARLVSAFSPVLMGVILTISIYLAYPALRLLSALGERQAPPLSRWILHGGVGGFIATAFGFALEFFGLTP